MRTKFSYEDENLSFAYLLGIYLTDGSVNVDQKKKQYRFRTRSVDKDIAENVEMEAFNLLGVRNTVRECSPSKSGFSGSRKFYEIDIYCKDLCLFFIESTNNKKTLPEFVYRQSAEWRKEFLAGVLDGDGWCSISKDRAGSSTTRKPSWYSNIGVCGQYGTYIGGIPKLLSLHGVKNSKYIRESAGYGNTKMIEIYINSTDFVDSGMYFRCLRKKKRAEFIKSSLEEYRSREVQRLEV